MLLAGAPDLSRAGPRADPAFPLAEIVPLHYGNGLDPAGVLGGAADQLGIGGPSLGGEPAAPGCRSAFLRVMSRKATKPLTVSVTPAP